MPIPYHTRPDNVVQVTDTVLENYLVAHKSAYQVEESRSIQYVTFPVTPTKEDEQVFQEELQALKKSFAQAKDDRAFAKINTDGNPHCLTSILPPNNFLVHWQHKSPS